MMATRSRSLPQPRLVCHTNRRRCPARSVSAWQFGVILHFLLTTRVQASSFHRNRFSSFKRQHGCLACWTRGGSQQPISSNENAATAPSHRHPTTSANPDPTMQSENHYWQNHENQYLATGAYRHDVGADGEYGSPFQETVQDRVDQWRLTQQQAAAQQTLGAEASTRDEQGRLKLLVSVSKGARALIFVMLTFRNLHLFEVAHSTLKGSLIGRFFVVLPLMCLFVANMAGVVSSFTSASHSAKKRLKAILNLDKVLECMLIVHSLIRLTILPSRYIAREVYIASLLHSVFFLLQCQAFTRVSWDEKLLHPMGPVVLNDAPSKPPNDDYDHSVDGNSESQQHGQSYMADRHMSR